MGSGITARAVGIILTGFVSTAPLLAQESRTHDVVPADYFSLSGLAEAALSPDGQTAAYIEARWDTADSLRKSDLWIVATDGHGQPRRLTTERANDRQPRWSADGKAIYVLGNRKHPGHTQPPYDGSTQLWRIPLDGTEPRALTRHPGGIASFDYAAIPDKLFYTVDAKVTDTDPFTLLREKFPSLEYGHGQRTVSELYQLDPVNWRAEKIVAENQYIREFAVSRDGQRLAMITAKDDSVLQSEGFSRVEVWDAQSKRVTATDEGWKADAGSPWPWLGHLAWNPAGTRLAFNTIFDGYPAEIIVQTFRDGRWHGKRLPRPDGLHVQGYGSPLAWADDDRLVALGERHSRVGLWIVRASGETEATTTPKHSVIGNLAMVPGIADWLTVHDPYGVMPSLRFGPEERILVSLNSHTKTWKLPTIRHITWKAVDGSTVGGVLELPPGYQHETGRIPLIVAIHGGPTTASKSELIFDPHNGRLYFSTAGYAVLAPNYRGSTGYGDKFLIDLIGRENDLDVGDILSGIQHLIAQGIADPERIGVTGWSNGGYLTNCLISRGDSPVQFRAASSGAGILDTVAEWGFNDEPAYPMVFKKGLPWQTPEIYRKTSPTYQLGNIRTPTLIHVGGNDVRCPPGHSRMLYRALREYVRVPTELVVYPNEPHGLTRMPNRQAKMEWDLAWFRHYFRVENSPKE